MRPQSEQNQQPAPTHDELTKSIKQEIKTWERDFLSENGRKPNKQDVYKDQEIFELYKLFNRLKTEPKKISNNETNEKELAQEPTDHDLDKPIATNNTLPQPSAATTQLDLAARTEALRKYQAKRNSQNINKSGKVVQSGIITPYLPPLNVRPKPKVPSPSETSPENDSSAGKPNSPKDGGEKDPTRIVFDDEIISHPTTVHIIAPELRDVKQTDEQDGKLPVSRKNAFNEINKDDAHSRKVTEPSNNKVGGMVSSTSNNSTDGSADPNTNQAPVIDVLASLGVDRLAIPSDVFKVVEENQVFRGHVARIKVPTRPNMVLFNLKNEANNELVACARREPSIKLKPTYYLFDYVSAVTESPRESACWKIKGNFEGSTFKILETRTGDMLGLIHYTSSCVPRSMLVVTSTPTSGPITARQYELFVQSHFCWPPAPTSELANSRLQVFTNQLPKYNETLKTFCLNFSGRVTLPSVKNFQLISNALHPSGLPKTESVNGAAGDETKVRLQFGRVANNGFSIDVHSPLMIIMGFAISLTTFDAIERV